MLELIAAVWRLESVFLTQRERESLLTLHLAAKLKLRRAKFPSSPPAVWGGGRIQSGALETPLKTL